MTPARLARAILQTLPSYHRPFSPGAPREQERWPQIYFGILATSLATLLLELSLTRLFSVIYLYHFAFLAISIALFGLGAGGIFSYVVAAVERPLFQKLGALACLGGAFTVASLCFLLSRTGELSTWELIAVYFVSAFPFFCSGAILSLIISETIERVHRTYFFDLLGAAAGCLVLVPFLNWIGGPSTVLVAAVLLSVSSAIWFHLDGSPRGRATAVALGLALVALITLNAKLHLVDVRYAKGKLLKGEEFVRWNSFSRIAIKPEEGTGLKSIVIDADAATGIASFAFDQLSAKERDDLAYHGPGLAYVLHPGARSLIIGPGGGWDVSRALASGSHDVTGVEINPIIATVIMRKVFPQYSRGLYFRPDVHIVVEDGRSFVRRSRERYDVLQATLVDTWASTAAGAFALSENNLYTVEAFTDYLSHLRPNGVLSFTRWGFDPPRESLRIVTLAQAALRRLGQTAAASNVVVVREDQSKLHAWGAQDTILVSRTPFTAKALTVLHEAARRGGLQVIYEPGVGEASPFRELLLSGGSRSFFDSYPYDVRPVNDDRPFFFYTVQPRDLLGFLLHASHTSADYKVNSAVPVLFGLVAVSLIATFVIMALPPLLLRSRLPRNPGSLRALGYFVCIGVGYILVQIALIQKFVLFLGHPTYALTVIIFTMLLASGIGSITSRVITAGHSQRLSFVLLLIGAAIVGLASVVPSITEGAVQLPLPAKIAITVVLIGPAAYLMGMPFPSGLRLLEAMMPTAVRWAWAVNAAASVLGSACAMFFAIYAGLSNTLLLGAVLYLGALCSLWLSPLRDGSREDVALLAG